MNKLQKRTLARERRVHQQMNKKLNKFISEPVYSGFTFVTKLKTHELEYFINRLTYEGAHETMLSEMKKEYETRVMENHLLGVKL